ncbi:MAG: PAS domain S-box protein [Methanotrichaceae archaeon]
MVEPYRILIIEDDPEHAELIKMGFRKHDEFFLDFAETGEAGLEMISDGTYDLISVDLVLPGIGGLDVLVRIRKLDPDIPVVMVSGHGTTEMAVIAFENRATKYVVKSMESFKSLPYIFENLIQEARFKANERKMREQIERSERIHRNVFENALAGIYILQDGLFRLVNPKLGEIFGCVPESLIGTPFWQLVSPDDMECVSKLERDKEGPAPIYESRVMRKDGTTRWIEFRTVPIEFEGRRAILGNLVDITQRKEQEIELSRGNRELSAINSILIKIAQPDGNTDKVLGDSLSDLISGMENAEIGGIFLQEEEGLVLRALFGSIEDLMSFTKDLESGILLNSPKIHKQKDEADYLWVSVPIKCNDKVQGAIIVASLSSDGNKAQSFLEKAALHIGHLIEVCGLQPHTQSIEEKILQHVQTGNMQE